MAQVVIKILGGMLMKMLTTKAVEELVLFGLDKLAKATESKVDDELVAIVNKANKGEPEKVAGE